MTVRAGGLYALYGLYLKQPIRPPIKIRMTLDDWRTMQEFIDTMRVCKHYDVVYIYTQLQKLNAFHHCATPQQEEYAFVDGD
ncbi:snRNA-activating protein complex subunit 1 [Anabrus simplex]|uniref:snRNA-activating protein complex subunit 1 n=1 Tax=Anabrus simplex TaxID=316456 RepID=UPI0034DD47C2